MPHLLLLFCSEGSETTKPHKPSQGGEQRWGPLTLTQAGPRDQRVTQPRGRSVSSTGLSGPGWRGLTASPPRRPRGAAPGLPPSRAFCLESPGAAVKPASHVGRVTGERSSTAFGRPDSVDVRSDGLTCCHHHTWKPHTRQGLKSAPSGLGLVWGPGACITTSCPRPWARGECQARPRQLDPSSHTNTHRSGGSRGLGTVLTTRNRVLVPPERLSQGGQGRGGGRDQPAGHRKTRGAKTHQDPARPTPSDQLSKLSSRGILRDHRWP